MRIAAMYDIHGNLPALEAVLDEIAASQPDLIVVGGDVAAGPMPGETIDRLLDLGPQARFVRGNADRIMVNWYDEVQPSDLQRPPPASRPDLWAARQLDRHQRDFLASFDPQAVFTVEGLGEVLFCHATPHDDEQIITAATPPAEIESIFSAIEPRVVVCGHTHMQYDRQIGRTRVVNAGSVGMPYGEPGAYWLWLGPEVELRHTRYDLDDAAARILASGYPLAMEFVERNLRKPPSAAEALAVFEKARVG